MTTIFVYGTLKRGFCREKYLTKQELIGEAITQPRYALVDCGDYPGLICVDDSDQQRLARSIHGELYEVDDHCLRKLDKVEDVDGGLYRFDKVQIESVIPNRDDQMSQNRQPLLIISMRRTQPTFLIAEIRGRKNRHSIILSLEQLLH